jgi:hypothetical protein
MIPEKRRDRDAALPSGRWGRGKFNRTSRACTAHRRRYLAPATSEDLTRQQYEILQAAVGRRPRYSGTLRDRMNRLGFTPNDELWQRQRSGSFMTFPRSCII